jgi:hypothetical protein
MSNRILIFGLLLLAVTHLRAGELLDRVVATVNGRVILQSDWQDEVRYESFVAGRELKGVSPGDRKSALDRLIDQELLREQAGTVDTTPASAEEVDKQLDAVKNGGPQTHGVQPWSEVLLTYRLEEGDIRNHIVLELTQLRLVDARLRPSIQVDAGEVEAYYKEHLAPAAGGQPISLQQAAPKIRELLTQEKMNQALSAWLQNLRSQAEIRIFASDSDPQGATQ